MTKQLTVRGVSTRLAERLEELARRKGRSVNATVLELLEEALGAGAREVHLRRYATLGPAEVEALDELIREQRRIDEDRWS